MYLYVQHNQRPPWTSLLILSQKVPSEKCVPFATEYEHILCGSILCTVWENDYIFCVLYYTLHVSRNMQIVVEMTFIMYSLIQKSRQVEFVFNHSEIFTIIIPSKMIKIVFILAIVVGLSF
jgi:hypothetical protein